MGDFDWTNDRVKMLKALWADGLSSEQIATELGGTLSRNAVIGKVHRLGLTGRSRNSSSGGPKTTARKPFRPAVMPDVAQPVVQTTSTTPPTPTPRVDLETEPPAVSDTGCTILQLNENTCRWPIGDPRAADFFFCGQKPLTGFLYCAYHHRLAFNRPDNRTRAAPRY